MTTNTDHSLIHCLHRSTHSMRAISAVVITCISWLSVYPLVAAAEEAAKQPPQSSRPQKAEEDKHGKAIESIQRNLESLDAKLKANKAWDTEKQALRGLKDQLNDLDQLAQAEFARDLEHINKHKLSDVIRGRHTDAVAKFKEESGKLKTSLDTITESTDNAQVGQAVNESLARLKAQNKKVHVPFDPNNLPFRTPDSKVRPPKLTQKEFAELFPKEQTLLADNGSEAMMIAAGQALNLPTAAELAPTEDVQITPAIQAKAAELNHNPVEIYNWVHNNVEFIPTYGSIQGSDYTLQNLRGNAFDTSSLLIALLRASNIPARYVYGTIQVP